MGLLLCRTNYCEQVKEEIANDADFLKPYSVPKTTGAAAAPSQQAPATATA